MSNFDSTYSAIASITDGKYDSTYSALKAAAVSMGAEDKDYDSEYSVAVALAEVAGNGGGSGGGSESSKPIIYNGFKFTGGDMSLVDFSQYDWRRVYDGTYFFSSSYPGYTRINVVKNTTDDWSNFENNFNGKFVSCAGMFHDKDDGTYRTDWLRVAPRIDCSSVVDTSYMFYDNAYLTTIPQMDTSNVTNMSYMFSGCKKLEYPPTLNVSNLIKMDYVFDECYELKEVRFVGDPSKLESFLYPFSGVNTEGVMYYDSRYDYSGIINTLPSGWVAVPFTV